MTELYLPELPSSSMFVGSQEVMTIEWQEFFRALFNRVGGTTNSNSDDIFKFIIAELYSIPKNYEKRINKLEKQLLSNLFWTNESFKYYLPHTVWDDLRFPASSVKGGGAFDTTKTAYRGGIVEAFSTGPNDESVQFIGQLPHSYKEGSDINFHIHWVIPVAGAGAGVENVKWDFTYSWANIDDSFPVESSTTITIDVQSIAAHKHMLTDIIEMDGSGKKISSVIICSLTRDVSVANDYANDAYFVEADFHFESDTIGSRLEVEK